MNIWERSRSFGAGSATTRKTLGLTRSVMALMVPPFPAVSLPSKTTQILAFVSFTHSCRATNSPCSRRSSLSYSLRFKRDDPSFRVADMPFVTLPPLEPDADRTEHGDQSANEPRSASIATYTSWGCGRPRLL